MGFLNPFIWAPPPVETQEGRLSCDRPFVLLTHIVPPPPNVADKNPSGFQDVTEGKNTGGMQEYGFEAITGWDPATGMGTPNYDALSKLV